MDDIYEISDSSSDSDVELSVEDISVEETDVNSLEFDGKRVNQMKKNLIKEGKKLTGKRIQLKKDSLSRLAKFKAGKPKKKKVEPDYKNWPSYEERIAQMTKTQKATLQRNQNRRLHGVLLRLKRMKIIHGGNYVLLAMHPNFHETTTAVAKFGAVAEEFIAKEHGNAVRELWNEQAQTFQRKRLRKYDFILFINKE